MDKLKKNKASKIIRGFGDFGTMKKSDVTTGMVRVIIVCWLIPYLALSLVLFYSSETKTQKQIRDTVTTSISNSAESCKKSLLAVVEESKEASYDGVIRESYLNYLKTNDEAAMYKTVSSYLNKTYKYSAAISNTIILFNRKTSMDYYTYSNIAGATYASINEFKLNAMSTVKAVSRNLGTDTKLVEVSKHLYLVRNLVTSDYTPYATLVMEINTDEVFTSIDNAVWLQDRVICVGNASIERLEDEETEEELVNFFRQKVLPLHSGMRKEEIVSGYDADYIISYAAIELNGQEISFVVKHDKVGILNEQSAIIYTYIIIIILLIPLLLATFAYFYNNISKPVSDLMRASERIREGEFGYKVPKFHRNEEFGRLIDTFNHMSVSLEDSFNRIYAEEIAVRDAKMEALQSQINPHFLNNTLEIINWKARMAGNDDVSGMIESLGIMMEATMNRNKESFISLREELKYVDAYLYIITQRFGSKFEFEKKIDERLLDTRIPRLIIQPLVENSVDHGGDLYGNRKGKLHIFETSDSLHIVVENNGTLSSENVEKIQKLLSSGEIGNEYKNIGIRNVNLRLKLLYGEQSGLTITSPEEGEIISEIVIEKSKLFSAVANNIQKNQQN